MSEPDALLVHDGDCPFRSAATAVRHGRGGGIVPWKDDAARRYYEDEGDLILTCTATPRSDLRIEVCKHEETLDHRAEHDRPPGTAKR
ncbi:hypothetical protein [Halegenticoccus soli]|uniref:hypothetical protein n=1 Tax=Halegenticoccus soli TaxID=1985678 RepID=UPI000C6D0CAC|nr:hypothetical protein [Halegenticoccus soli]